MPHVYAPKAMKPPNIFYWVAIGFTPKDLLSCPLLLTSLLLSTSLTLKPCLTFFCMVPRIFPSTPILISSMLLLLSSAPQSDLRSSKLFRGCKRVLLEVVLCCMRQLPQIRPLWQLPHTAVSFSGWRGARSFMTGIHISHLPFFIRCFVLLCFTASSITLTLPRSDRYWMSFRDTAVGTAHNFSTRVVMLHRCVRFLSCSCVCV